jgi:hypothetical protein
MVVGIEKVGANHEGIGETLEESRTIDQGIPK